MSIDDFLIDHPEYINANDHEPNESDTYTSISWLFGDPSIMECYYSKESNEWRWYSGDFYTIEKVSHYIPKTIERNNDNQ